ncbi:MAG: efflux RND transporter permease subunit, partial [Candidatus Aminicenantes bacterium]|nr:efflux RND transporter permease subunit [Candidatus Aminicenantes bacterium]
MKIFIERPIATATVFAAILILGVYSFLNLPFEFMPKEDDFPRVSISTIWSGVPPEIIQA